MDNDVVPPSSPPLHATNTHMPSSPLVAPHRRALSLKSSSPPPLFSSDDSRESVDVTNYESPRIFKNKRKGTWWDNGDVPSNIQRPKKTKMSRNFDSGVYMLSDASDGSELSLPLPHKSPFDSLDGAAEDGPLPAPQQASRQAKAFHDLLSSGLEENSTNYHFVDLDLSDDDIQDVGLLASIIRENPDPGNEQPAEAQYRSMTPEIYVSFRDNHLHRMTPSLFHLTNLTTLVLVNNKIRELPPQIAQLEKLQELNISRNPIRWLPCEFLRLLQPDRSLEILGDSGVFWLCAEPDYSFVQCVIRRLVIAAKERYPEYSGARVGAAMVSAQQLLTWSESWSEFAICLERHKEFTSCIQLTPVGDPNLPRPAHHSSFIQSQDGPKFFARSPISYLDNFGKLVGRSLDLSSVKKSPVIFNTSHGYRDASDAWSTPPSATSKSLFTFALQSALNHLSPGDVRDLMGEYVTPPIKKSLDQAEDNNQGGFGVYRRCHICQCQYVAKRAEWIEWWWSPQLKKLLPIMFRTCSWGCVPEEMRKPPEKKLDVNMYVQARFASD